MSSDTVIEVEKLSKCYQLYSQPIDRLLQMLGPVIVNAGDGQLTADNSFWQ